MFKALLKKQFAEINTWLLQNKKKGTRRSNSGIALMAVLYIFLFGAVACIFAGMSAGLCAPLCAMGLDWLYFAMMSLIAVLFGVFGSVFNTYSTLYGAKDNDLLLSMPIPPSYILTVRILGVCLWSFVYTAIVFIPALAVYMIYSVLSVPVIICGIILFAAVSLFVLSLSCILGWVVAKITAKLKNKSFITVIASLAFIIAYYIVYFKATEWLGAFLENAEAVGSKIKGGFLPIYWLGKAGTGNFLSLTFVVLSVLGILCVILYVMNRSFIKTATASSVQAKRKYVKNESKAKSVGTALFGKELKRFTSSANYMLNCALGTVILPVIGIAAVVKAVQIRELISAIELGNHAVLIICAAMCIAASLNDITAPSVSLEGKHIWIAQSLPVSVWDILKAKLYLHIAITEIPVIFCAACICAALKLGIAASVMCIILPVLFVALNALFGLFINLLFPNLNWTNEVIPLKQSTSVFIGIFGGWVFIIALSLLYFAVRQLVVPIVYLLICAGLILLLCALLIMFIKSKGTEIFKSL